MRKWVLKASLLASVLVPNVVLAQGQASTQLEEVIVTGTKQGATDLQDTPLAITAVGEAALERSLVNDVRGLSQLTPNLLVGANATYAQIYIRGIGSNNVFNGTDPSSTVHVDGVYYARPFSQFANFLDVERVEVLRGPQGTLYGRNSVGGTVNVVTLKPGREMRAKAQAVVGNYDLVDLSSYLSGPLSDQVQAGLALGYAHRSPFRENVVASGNDVDSRELKSGRLQIRYQPVSWLDAVTRVDGESVDGALAGQVPLRPFTPVTDSILGDFKKVALNVPNSYQVDSWGISEDILLGASEALQLRSITAHRAAESRVRADSDQTDRDLTITNLDDKQRQWSQEFNLVGRTDRLSYVLGAYYFQEKNSTRLVVEARAPGLLVRIFPYGITESRSIFAQGTYTLLPELSVTAGLRYTEEEKEFRQNYGVALASTGAYLPGAPLTYVARRKDEALTPKLGIDWRPAPDFLVYASATRGFKSGGYNLTSARPDQGFDPEFLWSYELGVKTELFDQRLRVNTSLFKYDYTDLQVQAFIRPGVSDITNAASANVKGAEVEIQASPVSALQLSGSLAWLDARYGSYPAAPIAGGGTIDASGNRLGGAPKYSVNFAGQYSWQLGGGDEVFLRGEYSWKSRVYFTTENLMSKSQGPVSVVNASVGWVEPERGVEVALWSRNLFDKQYLGGTGDVAAVLSGAPAEPRTFGVRLTFRR